LITQPRLAKDTKNLF